MEGKTSLWTIPSGIVRIDMQPRPGLSNFQGARDLFRDKKFVLEYARSTCAIQSRRGHLLRDTPPRTKSELSRRTFGRDETRMHALRSIKTISTVSRCQKSTGNHPPVPSPFSLSIQFTIPNESSLREIHILLL